MLKVSARSFLALLLLVVVASAKIDWMHFDGVAQVFKFGSGDILYRSTHGQMNVEHNVPMTFDAQFPIGSNTKLYTAVAAYQLQERGLLNVTAPVTKYLDAADFVAFGVPDTTTYCPTLMNSSVCQPITMQNLLSMSSGILDPFHFSGGPRFASYVKVSPYVIFPGTTALMVGTFISIPLLFAPGTTYGYSNPNYILATYIIQKLSGMSFHDYVQKFITSAIGLTDTYFDIYNGQFGVNARRVGEYNRFMDPLTGELYLTGQKQIDFDLGSLCGAGGIISTVADEATFYTTLFNFSSGGAPLLTAASLRQIVAPLTLILPLGPVPTYFGQGIVVGCQKGDEACAGPPTFLMYLGATLVVNTANIYDLQAAVMTQVFQSTSVYNVSQSLVQTLRSSSGMGNFIGAAAPYMLPGALEYAWALHNEYT